MLPSTSRLSYTTRRALALLLAYGELSISYEDLAAALGCERSTAYIAVRRLQLSGRIEVTRGYGPYPNRYRPV